MVARRIGGDRVGADAQVAAVQLGRDHAGDAQIGQGELLPHRLVHAAQVGVGGCRRRQPASVEAGARLHALSAPRTDEGLARACHGTAPNVYTVIIRRMVTAST